MQTEPMCSIEAAQFFYHVQLADDVAFICLCDKLYPKRLAFTFLDDLHREFEQEYPQDKVEAASRPYAFIKFDTFIQKVKRSYQDVRARQNLGRLQEELVDVAQVMQLNIKEVLERGTKIEKMSLLSSTLSEDSRKYLKSAKNLNWEMLKRKYGPPLVVLFIVLVFLYIWIKWL
jgi:vesicle transport protein SEC22